jgi:hypothetical protein
MQAGGMSENKVLRRTFGLKWGYTVKGSKHLCVVICTLHPISLGYDHDKRWAGHVARTRSEMRTLIFVGKLEGRDQLENLNVDGSTILKRPYGNTVAGC